MSTPNFTAVGPWHAGINTVRAEDALKKAELRDAVNVDLTDDGSARLREGCVRVFSGTGVHSLFQRFFVDAEGLKYLRRDYTAELVTTLTDVASWMSYEVVNDRLYFTNGTDAGSVHLATHTVAPLGIPTPEPPTLGATAGGLTPGTYLVAVSYVDASGEESGLSPAVRRTFGEGEGLQVTELSQRAGCATHIYVSPPDGDRLYRVATMPYGVDAFVLLSPFKGLQAAETRFLEPLPPGSIVRYYRGRLYLAVGTRVVFSHPLRYGLHHPAEDYFLFSEEVTVLQPVDDGLFIVADRTYFYRGDEPGKMEVRVVSPHRAAQHSGLRVDGRRFKFRDPLAAESAYWFSDVGAVVGSTNGRIEPLMEERVADRPYAVGASWVREHNGVHQVGTAVSRPGPQSSFQALDCATAVVRRNGVVVG